MSPSMVVIVNIAQVRRLQPGRHLSQITRGPLPILVKNKMEQIQEIRYSNGCGRKKNPSDSPGGGRGYAKKYKEKDAQRFLASGRARDSKWRKNNLEKSREQARIAPKNGETTIQKNRLK